MGASGAKVFLSARISLVPELFIPTYNIFRFPTRKPTTMWPFYVRNDITLVSNARCDAPNVLHDLDPELKGILQPLLLGMSASKL
jgi:hypothetical protein